MTIRYAVINPKGQIVNIVLWDETPYSEKHCEAVGEEGAEGFIAAHKICSGWKPPDEHTTAVIERAEIGGTFIDGVYTPPNVK